MELDVSLESDSLSINIDNPFHMDVDSLVQQIGAFLSERGEELSGLDVKGLLPRMVRGIAGCEKGCPADAKSFVSRGFDNFELAYVEGGILTASAKTAGGKVLSVKMFPEF
ncbi:MAG: hypothetical protein P8Z71_05435 [Candidatus Sulfobium sp.]|jgi:hypothetical protein